MRINTNPHFSLKKEEPIRLKTEHHQLEAVDEKAPFTSKEK